VAMLHEGDFAFERYIDPLAEGINEIFIRTINRKGEEKKARTYIYLDPEYKFPAAEIYIEGKLSNIDETTKKAYLTSNSPRIEVKIGDEENQKSQLLVQAVVLAEKPQFYEFKLPPGYSLAEFFTKELKFGLHKVLVAVSDEHFNLYKREEALFEVVDTTISTEYLVQEGEYIPTEGIEEREVTPEEALHRAAERLLTPEKQWRIIVFLLMVLGGLSYLILRKEKRKSKK